ncbi:MAG: NAD(P) transhydrogenase subunit alpha [Candidatus Actinomarina sp.]
MESEFFFLLLTTVLAGFLGYELISKIPQTLHTPLMSGSNAISGITIIAALTFVEKLDSNEFLITLVYIAIAFATINIVGGFLVTNRMLQMFRKKND